MKKRDPKTINPISIEFNFPEDVVLLLFTTTGGGELVTTYTVDEKLVTVPIEDRSKPPLDIPLDN